MGRSVHGAGAIPAATVCTLPIFTSETLIAARGGLHNCAPPPGMPGQMTYGIVGDSGSFVYPSADEQIKHKRGRAHASDMWKLPEFARVEIPCATAKGGGAFEITEKLRELLGKHGYFDALTVIYFFNENIDQRKDGSCHCVRPRRIRSNSSRGCARRWLKPRRGARSSWEVLESFGTSRSKPSGTKW